MTTAVPPTLNPRCCRCRCRCRVATQVAAFKEQLLAKAVTGWEAIGVSLDAFPYHLGRGTKVRARAWRRRRAAPGDGAVPQPIAAGAAPLAGAPSCMRACHNRDPLACRR